MSNLYRQRRLPWPASRIERDVLHELWQASQRSGTRISVLVALAVSDYLERHGGRRPSVPPSSAIPMGRHPDPLAA
jgi:hypothetical protein